MQTEFLYAQFCAANNRKKYVTLESIITNSEERLPSKQSQSILQIRRYFNYVNFRPIGRTYAEHSCLYSSPFAIKYSKRDQSLQKWDTFFLSNGVALSWFPTKQLQKYLSRVSGILKSGLRSVANETLWNNTHHVVKNTLNHLLTFLRQKWKLP